MHPSRHPGDVRQVGFGDAEYLETVASEQVLAADVLGVPERATVVGAVVLADHACDRVEEVGGTEQPAAEVEHGLVDPGRRQAGIEHPHESHPGLPGRQRVLVREVERGPDLGDSGPAGTTCEVGPYAGDRRDLGSRHHVHRHDSLSERRRPPHGVEQPA